MIRSRRGRRFGLALLAHHTTLAPGRVYATCPPYVPARAGRPAAVHGHRPGRGRFAVPAFTAAGPDPTELPCRDGTAGIVVPGDVSFHRYLRDAIVAELGAAMAEGDDSVPVRVHLTRLQFDSYMTGHWHIEGTVRVGGGSARPVAIAHELYAGVSWEQACLSTARAFPDAVAAFNRAVIALLP